MKVVSLQSKQPHSVRCECTSRWFSRGGIDNTNHCRLFMLKRWLLFMYLFILKCVDADFSKVIILLCDFKPGAAGLRGFPVPPQSRRISLYCSSLQQSSWRPESYPGWEKTKDRWTGLTRESINCFITSLTGHLLAIFSSNTTYCLMLACPVLSLVTQIRMFGATWSNFKINCGCW